MRMRMRNTRFVISILLALALTASGLLPGVEPRTAYAALAQTVMYKVFCVNGQIEIDTSTLAEMKSSRGQNVCQLTQEEYATLSEARTAAKRFGGVGAPCRCP
jgi:hypothetical protein